MSAAQRIGDVGMYTVEYKFNCKNRTVYAICDLTVTYGSCSSILMSNAKYVSTKSCGVILSDFLQGMQQMRILRRGLEEGCEIAFRTCLRILYGVLLQCSTNTALSHGVLADEWEKKVYSDI